jgi:uncharacterized membrane protein
VNTLTPDPSPSGEGSKEEQPRSVMYSIAAFSSAAVLRRTIQRITTLSNHPQVRVVALTLFYLAILLALIALYGKGDFTTPPFIYQGY